MPLKTALLYSGRFYGGLTPEWIKNHVEHLVVPFNASVFVVAEPSSWCAVQNRPYARALHNSSSIDALGVLFEAQVKSAFAPYWDDVHARLLPDEDVQTLRWYPSTLPSLVKAAIARAHDAKSRQKVKLSPFYHMMLRRWYRQAAHIAAAELLRRQHGPHDLIIRARIDTT